jgi:ferredoxin-NADP reductase
MIRLERPFQFLAGQHIDVRLTAPDGYRAMRSYSIASAPAPLPATSVEIMIELLTNGEVSPFFHETVQVGDAIELRGPLGGHFVLSQNAKPSILLLGGGSGVVPLMSMVRYSTAAFVDRRVVLFQSARRWDDVLFRRELIELHEKRIGFSFVLSLTREAKRRPQDLTGRIDRAASSGLLENFDGSPAQIFICGSNAFVDVAADSVIAVGAAPAVIKTERYGG